MRVDFETDVGAVRSSNQDSCDCGLFSPNSAWVIVCDGMGGANGGNVASAIAVETIREQLLSGYDENLSKPNLKNLMINAINRANEEVHRVSLERPELHGMGTTVVLLVAAKGTLTWPRGGQPCLPAPRGRPHPNYHGPLLCAGFGELWPNHPRGGPGPPQAEHHHPGAGRPRGGPLRLRRLGFLPGGIWPWPVPTASPTTWTRTCWTSTWRNMATRAAPFPGS
mgnify:CR=1 FL=1